MVAQRESTDRSARGEDFCLATSEDIKLLIDTVRNAALPAGQSTVQPLASAY